MQTLGDVDGNGFDDILCGVRTLRFIAGGAGPGVVRSININLSPSSNSLASGVGVVVAGAAPAGDVDGDGIPDVAFLTRNASGVDALALWCTRLSRDGSALTTTLLLSGAEAPAVVASTGDVTGDGVGDLLLGGPLGLAAVPLVCPQCARAVAMDTGRQPGLGKNDSVLLQFPCNAAPSPFATTNAAGVDAVVAFSAPLGAGYSGAWASASSLIVTVTNTSGASTASTRTGLGGLTATALVCSRATYSVAGSWGTAHVPLVVSVLAVDGGHQPGLGNGDFVLVTFDTDVDMTGATLAVNASLGATQRIAWLSPRSWRLDVLQATGAAAPGVTRVGELTVTGRLRSADLSSGWGAVASVIAGSWGDLPPPVLLSAVAYDTGGAPGLNAGDRVVLEFNADTSMPPAQTVLTFDGLGTPAYAAAWASPRQLIVTFRASLAGWPSPNASAAASTRVGFMRASVTGDVRSPDLSSPPCRSSLLLGGSWGNGITSVSSSNPQALSTAGGELVTLGLAYTLGAAGSRVSATYSQAAAGADGGGRSYVATGCIVTASGAAVQCSSSPGVGTLFLWWVVLDGLPLAKSVDTTSYGPPVITDVAIDDGDGGLTGVRVPSLPIGGQRVVVYGRNFGPPGAGEVSNPRFHPSAYPSVVFEPRNCSVTTVLGAARETVTCTMPGSAGSDFVFSLVIGGQNTTVVSLPAAPPVITHVRADGPLDAGGGTRINITGTMFGVAVGRGTPGALRVTYGPTHAFVATDCNMTVANTEIFCLAAPGYGGALAWELNVLGLASAAVFVSDVRYEWPVIDALDPAVVSTTGGSVTVHGSGFTPAFLSVMSVSVDGVVTAPLQVLDTTTLVLAVPAGVGATKHTIAVAVGAVWSAPMPFAYARPVITSATPYAGSVDYWDVQIAGMHFGGPASRDAVNATVAGTPCVLLSVADSGIVCRTPQMAGGLVSVEIAGQGPDAGAVTFDPSVSLPTAILSGVVSVVPGTTPSAAVGAPLTGGGSIALAGNNLRVNAPAVGVLLRTGPQWVPDVDCPAAVAAVNASHTSNYCVAVVWTPSAVTCVMPASTTALVFLANLAVIGDACTPTAPVAVRYDAPVVASAAPATLRTTGGETLTLRGTGFPLDTRVYVNGAECTEPRVASSMLVTCVAPAGAGTSVLLILTSTAYIGSGAATQALRVAYRAPIVSACDPSSGPTMGGGMMVVHGSNFALHGATAAIGPYVAAVANVSADGTIAHVVAPPGHGAALNMSMSGGGQTGSLPRAYSYAPPSPTSTTPLVLNAVAGGIVVLNGTGFVPLAVNVSALAVTINGVPCSRPLRLSDAALQCVAPPMLVSHAAVVVVTIDGVVGPPGLSRVACPAGYFGAADGSTCSGCPSGALCGGLDDVPLPLAGFARVSETVFVACVPPESCVALDALTLAARERGGESEADAFRNCAGGYTGSSCRSCTPGFYRNGQQCVPCPALSALYLILFVVLLLCAGALGAWLQRSQINLKGTGADVWQQAQVFGFVCCS